MQYVEMIVHNCKSVHAPGVAWPEYAVPETRAQVHIKHKRGAMKKIILAFLDDGGTYSSRDINDAVGGPVTSTRTFLLVLETEGEVEVTYARNRHKRPINLYTRVKKCKLH